MVRINGEAGTLAAAVWCKDHIPSNRMMYRISDIVQEGGPTAMQLFVQTSKQADLALTGTVRKATLITQSTKALPAAAAGLQNGNRRVSTATVSGTTSSVTVAKSEEAVREGADSEIDDRSCATCKTCVTPKWWPFPPVQVAPTTQESTVYDVLPSTEKDSEIGAARPEVNADTLVPKPLETHELPKLNGTLTSEDADAGTVAMAAAALHQEPVKTVISPAEFQCHKCHFRKVKKEQTPVPPPSPPPNLVKAVDSGPRQRGTPNTSVEQFAAERPASDIGTHYTWPQQSQGYNSGPAITWHRPSPNPQSMINGTHSPRTHYGQAEGNHGIHHYGTSGLPHNDQPHMRPPVAPIPHSPHQNGQIHHLPNGYPQSPHRNGPPPALTNGGYAGYPQPPRPQSQHMPNGMHSPHLAERPYSNDYSTFGRPRGPSFGSAPTSPPVPRDPFFATREMSPRGVHPPARPMQAEYPAMSLHRVSPSFGAPLASPSLPVDPRLPQQLPPPPVNGNPPPGVHGPPSNDRPVETRVNGGASASPSVKNLLS